MLEKFLLFTNLIRNNKQRADNILSTIIESRMAYCVNIEDIYYHMKPALMLLFENAKKDVIYNQATGEFAERITIDMCSSTTDICWYKNIPIIFRRTSSHGGYSSGYAVKHELITINTKRAKLLLKEFVRSTIKKASTIDEIDMNEGTLTIGPIGSQEVEVIGSKTWNDVFIPSDQQKRIIDGIKAFQSKIDWLEEMHIPTHYGLLLHGDPGTGKTSIIKAILNEFPRSKAHYIQSLHMIPEILHYSAPHTRQNHNKLTFIVCEDVDAGMINRKTEAEYMQQQQQYSSPQGVIMPMNMYNKSLSDILNSMDGVVDIHNVVFIFTTNHIEKLDWGINRPGRIDQVEEIKPICEESLNMFMKKFFNKGIPDDFKIKGKKLFAELQVRIIGGATYEDILKYMATDDSDKNITT